MKREISRLLTILAVLLLGLFGSIAKASAIEPDAEGNYPLQIGDTRVTDDNKENVLGDTVTGKVSYDPTTNTLTFDGVTRAADTIDDLFYLVYEGKDEPLRIEIKGKNDISYGSCGFSAEFSGFVFTGTGDLTLFGPADAVFAGKSVTIEENCTVYATSEHGMCLYVPGTFECAGTVKVFGVLPEAEGVRAKNIKITGSFITEEIIGKGIIAKGEKSRIVIDGGTVNVSGISSEGTIDIINRSKVTSEVKSSPETEREMYVPGICADSDITISDSTVTATSDSDAGIACYEESSAKFTIKNSTVVAKSIPTDRYFYIYPGDGIHLYEGQIILSNSDVTAEGCGGIYLDDGDITITGGNINAVTKMAIEGVHPGIHAGNDCMLTITDAKVTVESAITGMAAEAGEISISGGDLDCKAGYVALDAAMISIKESAKGAPVVGISSKGESGTGISAKEMLIDAGVITISDCGCGIYLDSPDPEGNGLRITNGITNVTIEATECAVFITLEDKDARAIELGDQLVIKEPEGGKLSDDATEFVDTANNSAKKVVIVKECAITFDANGGTGAMTGTSVEAGGEYELPSCGFTAPKGKAFGGWLVDDATETLEPGKKITVTKSVVIKPQWVKIVYKITKGADGTWKEGDGAYEIIVVTEPDPSVCWPSFLSVACDGSAWTNGSEYDGSEGSTKILIKEDTLKALDAGGHDIVIAFTDAEVVTTLTISKKSSGGDDNGGDDNGGDDNGGDNNGGDNNGGDNNGGDNNGDDDNGGDDNGGDNNGGDNNGGNNNGGNNGDDSPKTGDSMPYELLLLIAAFSAACFGACIIFKRRSERA